MHGRADYDDMERTPQRYLRREWKRNKPHLSPSDSLPTLRLCPNRPLFVCGRCGFANTWIPLCLWCAWSSAEATTVFERNMPRPRRLSAPSKIVTPPKTAWRGSPRTVSVESKGRSIEPITPLKDVPVSTHHKALLVQGWVDSTRHSKSRLVDNAIFDRVIKTKMEVMDPEDEVTRATSLLPNDDDRHSFSASGTRVRHYRKPLALHLSHARSSSRSDPKIPCGRANDIFTFQGMHSMTSVLSETSNSTHATDDLFAANAAHVDSTVSVQSSHCAPTHTLRRKRPMMLPNRESFGSMHPHSRPSSPSPVCGSKDTSSPSTGTMQSQAPTSPSGSDPLVRLGHPSRPYYSAIRKNMSRPSSPVLPRTPSPILSQFEYVPRGTKSLDGGERPYTSLHYAHHSRPMSMILPGQTYSGFSLSGETEMRINLARWRQEDAPDAPGDYLFQERSRSRIRTKMKHSVRKLGKSLKHLVLGKP
ncbi:hypothetical protein J3A83DRAFT_1498763 [Scleroderma citrinum]